MIVHCKDLGFKPSVWKVKDNTVSVTFPDATVPLNFNEGITEGIIKLIDEGIDKRLIEGITEGVRESMIQIVSLILTEKA